MKCASAKRHQMALMFHMVNLYVKMHPLKNTSWILKKKWDQPHPSVGRLIIQEHLLSMESNKTIPINRADIAYYENIKISS